MRDKKEKKPISYSNRKKLMSATAMLLVSALMLITTTVAWFTMNKEVSITGMQMKAHAEEGLLINEVATAGDANWDEQAQGDSTPTQIALRPASTSDFATFWHANSKKSNIEAGMDDKTNTVAVGNGYYKDVTEDANGISDQPIVAVAAAAGNSKAETHVYYDNASFGTTDNGYDNGEGYYVKYKYYLKSSGETALNVNNLQVKVKATKNGSGTSDNLDKALRVGVQYGTTGLKIFAPINGADASYDVTADAAGTTASKVTVSPIVAGTTGDFTAYTKINTDPESIPAVTSNGSPVYVYVWFEGEDTNCKSDNLTTAISAYDIDINIKDADLGE